jgi:hypothetical protein
MSTNYPGDRPALFEGILEVMLNKQRRYYHPFWMAKLRLPPVPLWTVGWLFDLMDLIQGRRRKR